MPGSGWKAAIEATLRIAPAPRSTIARQERAGQLVRRASTLSRTTSLLALERRARGSARAMPKPALLQTPTTSRSPACSVSISAAARRGVGRGRSVSTSTWTPWASRSSSASSLEPLAAARDEDEVVAALGELARELGADAGRRAGDEDGGAVA